MQRKARKDQKVPEPNAVEIFKDCHQQDEGHDYTSQSHCYKSLILMPFNYYLLWLVPWTAWFGANVYYSFQFYTQLS